LLYCTQNFNHISSILFKTFW